MVDTITKPSTSSIKDSQQDQCSNDKDSFLCVDELFEDEPGKQAATAEIVENFIEDINDYEEEFWDDSDWEPFGEESDESENEFSSIKRSNKRKASRQLFAPSSKKATILTGQSNNPLPLAHQSNTQDSSSNDSQQDQCSNDKDSFLCVDELFEDEPGKQAATAEIVENFIEDINDYEEEFWDDSDWEPFGEESDESENEFSSIKRSNKRKASRQLFAPSSKKATILTGQSNNPLPLAHQSNTQDSSSNDSQQDQCSNDKDSFLCVDELFEDEPGKQAATAEIVENFIEDINDYEEEFWDDSDWEPFGEESDESENEFSSIKRSNKRKASRQLFAPSSKKSYYSKQANQNNPLPLAHQSNTQDSSSNDSQQDQCSNDKDSFLCVDELFEDEPGSRPTYQTNQDNLTCLEMDNNLRS
ncbi:uncharacterized protein LOC124371101 [Homalodisca vitripennis]|uniref:uncharacterized protein LOC124371101 n=1 Tax=Homalodisca vitripennis TaxID=197043 RepID=UPI001EEADABF|nr:uncharacterized protein LOC124371101 [Homalodisca vitripennis]